MGQLSSKQGEHVLVDFASFTEMIALILNPHVYVQECLWIHHWLILQFIHPHFSVDIKQELDERNPDGTPVFIFKHENWKQFISSMEGQMLANYYERHQTYPNFDLVWISHRTVSGYVLRRFVFALLSKLVTRYLCQQLMEVDFYCVLQFKIIQCHVSVKVQNHSLS